MIEQAISGINFAGSIEKDSFSLFSKHGHIQNSEHCNKVANGATELAKRFKLNEENAAKAGYLHDISEIIPEDKMVQLALESGINVYDEEKKFPLILHQKLSKVLAVEIFNIKDYEVLSAIECHTTLKASPKPLDLVLFLADKLSWEKTYNEGYIDDILKGLEVSLEHGAFAYIKYLYDNRDNLKVLHPWTFEAYNYLGQALL